MKKNTSSVSIFFNTSNLVDRRDTRKVPASNMSTYFFASKIGTRVQIECNKACMHNLGNDHLKNTHIHYPVKDNVSLAKFYTTDIMTTSSTD